MTPPPISDLVYTNLKRGRDAGRTLGDLAESMGVTRRQIEASVQQLKLDGFPVATGREGVWLEETSVGMMAQYRALRSRALSQLRGAAAVKRTAFRLLAHEQKYEQEVLFWPTEDAA